MNLSNKHFYLLATNLLLFAFLLVTAHSVYADELGGDKPAIGSDEDIRERWKAILQKEETPEVMEEKRLLYIEIMRRESDSRTHDFDVSGMVVDEEGRPLKDVTILYGFRTRTGWEQFKKDGGQKQVDGEFSITGGKWETLNITVRKEGYYDESLSFSGPPAEQMLDSILKGDKPNTRKVKVDDLVVTLVKQGEMTYLREYGREVAVHEFVEGFGNGKHTIYRADGSGVAINLSDDGSRRDWKPEDTWTDVPNLNDLRPAPPLLVYVQADVEDGMIPNNSIQDIHAYGESGGPRRLPKHLLLRITDPEGGFIHFPVEDRKAFIYDRFNRGMRQAPETGYEPTLAIYPDRQIPVYFFIKAGNRYGKGVLHNVRVAEDGSRVDCEVKLYIQPDGSRNLETLRFGTR